MDFDGRMFGITVFHPFVVKFELPCDVRKDVRKTIVECVTCEQGHFRKEEPVPQDMSAGCGEQVKHQFRFIFPLQRVTCGCIRINHHIVVTAFRVRIICPASHKTNV